MKSREIEQGCLGTHSILGAVTQILFENAKEMKYDQKVIITVHTNLSAEEGGILNNDIKKLKDLGAQVTIGKKYFPLMTITLEDIEDGN